MKNIHRSLKIFLIPLITSFLLGICLTGTVNAKSLYILASHNRQQFDAWNIAPAGTVTKQGTYNLSCAPYPAGVAIHEPSKTLFISSESNDLEMVDATTLTSLGCLHPTQTAGLAVDDVNNIVYGIRRSNNTLYVYDFDPNIKTLTLKTTKVLPIASNSGMGLALDENAGILWVADGGNSKVRAIKTSDLTEDTTLTFTSFHNPVGIGIDRVRGYIYTGSMTWGAGTPGTGDYYIGKFDLNTRTETKQDMGDNQQVVDISVDEYTGLVYVSESYCMSVWDSTTTPWTLVQRTAQLSSSVAGICVTNSSYMPDLTIDKTDDVAAGGCVSIGDFIKYTMSYQNTGNMDLSGVTIVDALPAEADVIVPIGNGGVYDGATHSVTWTIGNVATGASGSVQLDVQVNSGATPGSTIINYATIDSNQTASTTVQENTAICTNQPPVAKCKDVTVSADQNCQANASIDDGSYDPDGDPITLAQNPPGPYGLGDTLVTLTVTDSKGATATCTGTVTVVDNTPPMVSHCVPDITVNNDPGQCGAKVSWTPPTFIDNCGQVTVTSTHNPGDFFPAECAATAQGTVVTYTATDAAGNTTVCSFTVTVIDAEAPVVTGCPADITVTNDPGQCGAKVSWRPPTFTDNCNVTVTSTHNPGDFFPAECKANAQGTVVTYTATDDCGNTTSCSFTVTVIDAEAPVVTIAPLAAQYLSTEAIDICYTVADNCDPAPAVKVELSNNGGTPVDITAPSCIHLNLAKLVGQNIVTVTATDKCGNVGTASVSFEVILHLVGDQIVLKDEVQKMGYATFIAILQFPQPYDALNVSTAVADGAPVETINHDWIAHKSICRFNRANITEYPIDDYFEVTGLFVHNGVICKFSGADWIYRPLPPPRSPFHPRHGR